MQRHVLHCLHGNDWIKFRLCVSVYKCVHEMAPGYLSQLCSADQFPHFKNDVTCVLLVAATVS